MKKQGFSEIINYWDSPDHLANAIGAKYATVIKWRQRNNIPAEWWLDIVDAAAVIKKRVTVDELAVLAARKNGRAA
jgi:hypothetical protein